MKRAVLIILALVALLVFSAAVYIALTFRPDEYRPAIEEAVSRKIGRKVTMGKLSLTFSGGVGVEVEDFHVVGDARNPDESPVKFRRGKLLVAILPLFKKEVVIRKVVLDSPRIYVRKYPDGSLSVDDIFDSLRGSGAVVDERKGGGEAAIQVRIDSVEFRKGGITFISEAGGKPSVVTIYPFNLKITNLGFGRKSNVRLSLEGTRPLTFSAAYRGTLKIYPGERGLEKVEFHLEGKSFGIPNEVSVVLAPRGRASEFECVISSDEVSPKRLAEVYKGLTGKDLPVRSEGKGRILLAAGGTTEEFGYELEVDVTDAAIFFDRKFEKYLGQSLDLIIQGRYISPKFYISNGEFRIPNLLSSINAEFDSATGRYRVAFSLDVENVRNVLQYFPVLSPYHATGGVTASLRFSGEGRKWKLEDGAADLKRLNFDLPGREVYVRNMQGHVEFDGREITFNPLSALVSGQKLTVVGHGEFSKTFRGVFTLSADYLDLDSLVRQIDVETGGKGKGPAGGRTPLEGIEGVNVAIEFRAGGLKVRGVELQKVSGDLEIRGGSLKWDNSRWSMFGGDVVTSGFARLGGERRTVDFDLRVDGVSAFDLLRSLTELGGVLDGAVYLNFKGKSEFGSFGKFLEGLEGRGLLKLVKGKVVNVDLVRDVFALIGDGNLPSEHRKLRKFTEFDEVTAPFVVRAGEFSSDRFVLKGEGIALLGKAAVSPHGRVEFTGDLRLPRSLARRLKGPLVKKGRDGIYVPVRIAGPINGLKVLLDPRKVIERKGRDLLENIIREKFFRKR